MKRNSLLLFFCLFLSALNAQVRQDTVTNVTINSYRLHRPSLAIKFAPTALVNWSPGFLFSVEHSIRANQSFEYEVAFLNDMGYENRDFVGYQLGLGYRFYRDKKFGRKRNKFFMPILRWKQTFANGTGSFVRYNSAYTQIMDYNIRNSTLSLLLTLGRAYQLNDNFTLEYSYGLGARYLNIVSNNLPSDAVFLDNEDFGFFDPILDIGQYVLPQAIINLKIGYILK